MDFLSPCSLLSEKSPSALFLAGAACLAFVCFSLLTGKTVGETKYNSIGRWLYRDEEPKAFCFTNLLLVLLAIFCWTPLFGCN